MTSCREWRSRGCGSIELEGALSPGIGPSQPTIDCETLRPSVPKHSRVQSAPLRGSNASSRNGRAAKIGCHLRCRSNRPIFGRSTLPSVRCLEAMYRHRRQTRTVCMLDFPSQNAKSAASSLATWLHGDRRLKRFASRIAVFICVRAGGCMELKSDRSGLTILRKRSAAARLSASQPMRESGR